MRHRLIAPACLGLAVAAGAPAFAQIDTTTTPAAQSQPVGAPVIYGRDTLFVIQTNLGPFSAQERAQAVLTRLKQIQGNPTLHGDTVTMSVSNGATDLLVGNVMITAVTEADARAAGTTRAALARDHAAAIGRALQHASWWGVAKAALIGLLKALLATAVLVAALWGMGRLFRGLRNTIEAWRGTRIPAIRIQRLELLSANRVTDGLLVVTTVVRVALVVILLFYYVPLVFSFFPWTQNLAATLLDYILTPLKEVGSALLDYIPNLFYIAVIVLATRYLLRFIRLFFDGIARETIKLQNFHPEWGIPTYKIVRFLVFAFAFVVLWPYLPGSQSAAFKGVSVFIGVLVSFGSSSAISNIVAGIVITYMRPFKIGDRVQIADTTGDVNERTLLHTRVRTIKQVDITIPNAMVLSSHIINYSATAKDGGVILHTTVTIGFDAPWRKIHELLIAAAHATPGLLADPAPFVLQTALDDFYVHYQVNAYSDQPNKMATIYSDLHQNIQDRFYEAGVEILSPHFGALRDGNSKAIPEEYLPKGYTPPGFRVVSRGKSEPGAP